MRHALYTLSHNFEGEAQPAKGRYVNDPAITDEKGVVFVHPAEALPVLKILSVSLGSYYYSISFSTIQKKTEGQG